MRVLGYYIDTSKDQRRGEYTDPLCADHAAEFAAAMGYDLDAEYCAPIFSDTESDSITVCYMCGEIIDHALTCDGDHTYETPIAIHVKRMPDQNRATVIIELYNGSTRRYYGVSLSSANRVESLYASRIATVQTWGDRRITYAVRTESSVTIKLCGYYSEKINFDDDPVVSAADSPSPLSSGVGVSSVDSGEKSDQFFPPLPDRFVYSTTDRSIAPLRDRQLCYFEWRIQRASESGNLRQWGIYSARYNKLLKRAPRPKVGMIATLGYGKDRIDFKVTNVSDTGKVIRIGRVGLTPLYYLARQINTGEFVIFWRGIETVITLDPRS